LKQQTVAPSPENGTPMMNEVYLKKCVLLLYIFFIILTAVICCCVHSVKLTASELLWNGLNRFLRNYLFRFTVQSCAMKYRWCAVHE
jgi:hypothetical protein